MQVPLRQSSRRRARQDELQQLAAGQTFAKGCSQQLGLSVFWGKPLVGCFKRKPRGKTKAILGARLKKDRPKFSVAQNGL